VKISRRKKRNRVEKWRFCFSWREWERERERERERGRLDDWQTDWQTDQIGCMHSWIRGREKSKERDSERWIKITLTHTHTHTNTFHDWAQGSRGSSPNTRLSRVFSRSGRTSFVTYQLQGELAQVEICVGRVFSRSGAISFVTYQLQGELRVDWYKVQERKKSQLCRNRILVRKNSLFSPKIELLN